MSIHHSTARCDWCNAWIEDHEDVACRPCYEKLETYVAALEKELEIFRAEAKSASEGQGL